MLENINWIAIGLSVVAAMAIGAAWYSTLAKPWIAANGFTDEQIAHVNDNKDPSPYIVAAISHLVMAFILAGVIFHAGPMTLGNGITTGFLVWLGFVATTMAVNHRFQMKPWSLTLLDSGHYLVILLVQGAIIGWFGV